MLPNNYVDEIMAEDSIFDLLNRELISSPRTSPFKRPSTSKSPQPSTSREFCHICDTEKGAKFNGRFLKWNIAVDGESDGEEYEWINCERCGRGFHQSCLEGSVGESTTCFFCDFSDIDE